MYEQRDTPVPRKHHAISTEIETNGVQLTPETDIEWCTALIFRSLIKLDFFLIYRLNNKCGDLLLTAETNRVVYSFNFAGKLTYKCYRVLEEGGQILRPMVVDGDLHVFEGGVVFKRVGNVRRDVQYIPDSILIETLKVRGVLGVA